MFTKLKKSNSEGFTIIEVMIVLAIAALILLIVLLAVPALQRNSRNTQIKNDAANIVGAVSTYESDNDGVVPTSITASSGTVTLSNGAATPITSTATIQAGTTINAAVSGASPTAPTTVAGGSLTPWFGHTCGGVSTSRAIAIYYPVETSGGTTVKCVNS